VTLLSRAVGALRTRDVPHCLIGAAALAAHGVSRSTQDLDDVRRGEPDDPLAGVVRLEAADENAIDVVVGRAAWQRSVIERARPVQLDDLELPVAEAPDIVLLKLYAGGPQDLWDIQQLLDTPAGRQIAKDAEARLAELPSEALRLWARIRT